jgi:polar amino acid transport system permease protein
MSYEFDFGSILANPTFLWRGLQHTLALYVVALAAGLVLGLVVGMGRYSRRKALNWPATAFVELFRNTPVLVQMMWFFFALPIVLGTDLTAYQAALLALSLNGAANIAEIYRAGIQSLHRSQWEAGAALGMTRAALMRRVILPQAVRRMIPAFSNRAIELAKMTTLASSIAYAELLYEARLLSSQEFNPIEAFTAVALTFFVVLYPFTILVRRLEVDARFR